MGRPPKAATPLGRRWRRRLCFLDMFLIILYHRCLWIFLIYSIYIFHIYFLAMFHIFSLVCFLIYGVNRRQVLITKQCLHIFSNFTPLNFLLEDFALTWSFWDMMDMSMFRLLVQCRTLRVQNLVFNKKILNDSASFLLEKLKNHVISTKNLNIWSKSRKHSQNPQYFTKNPKDTAKI